MSLSLRDEEVSAIASQPIPPERPSGVRTKAAPVLDRHERPTLPPPGKSEKSARVDAPLHELLYRFHVGDHKGALAAASELLDRTLVPVVIVPRAFRRTMPFDHHEAAVLSAVDDTRTLEEVIEASTLSMLAIES